MRRQPGSTVTQFFKQPSDCLRAVARGAIQRKFRLSRRPLEILEEYADGSDKFQIARKIGRSVRTVEDHTDTLKRTLGVEEPSQLVALWLRAVYEAVDALGLHIPPHGHDEQDRRSQRP